MENVRDIDYMISVMQAYRDGKEIEVVLIGRDDWRPSHTPSWDWECCDYRVKPEPSRKEIVPYESAEEFMQAQRGHGLYLICGVNYPSYRVSMGTYTMPLRATNSDIKLDSSEWVEYKNLCNHFTWQDGTPCGKEVSA